MASKLPNLYKVLDISEAAGEDEIDEAYREKAKEVALDRGYAKMSEKERARKERKMQLINESHDILSDPEKRREYDELRRMESLGFSQPEIMGKAASIFSPASLIWGGILGMGMWAEKRDPGDYFLFRVNDIGLLYALIQAYKTKKDGKWEVLRSEKDHREGLPKVVYKVKREGEKVSVFRSIADWRSEGERKESIEVIEEGRPFVVQEKIDPSWLLNEWYLSGEGRNRIVGGWRIPYEFGEHLRAMKSLARKIACKQRNPEGDYDVYQEREAINNYSWLYHEWQKGKLFREHELVKQVSFGRFWQVLEKAKGRVVRIEGQRKAPEGNFASVSGESKEG